MSRRVRLANSSTTWLMIFLRIFFFLEHLESKFFSDSQGIGLIVVWCKFSKVGRIYQEYSCVSVKERESVT